ncbi:unnamed protein product [Paramecium sonneborni]|uniref:RING-type domain-containing protein n=1 Tax=Paramecium sonneborni TaxID=65129 RepID=A0A8S1LK84_9CILI|nr:unnamed protein product [Paramecium sonneborni]
MQHSKKSNISIKEVQHEKCLNCNKPFISSQLKDHQAICAVIISEKDFENLDQQLALLIEQNKFQSNIFGYPNQANQNQQLKPKIQIGIENVPEPIKHNLLSIKPAFLQNQDLQVYLEKKQVSSNQTQPQSYKIQEQFDIQQLNQQDQFQRDDLNKSKQNQIKITENQIEPQQFLVQNKITQDAIQNQNLHNTNTQFEKYQQKQIPLENKLQVNSNTLIQEKKNLKNAIKEIDDQQFNYPYTSNIQDVQQQVNSNQQFVQNLLDQNKIFDIYPLKIQQQQQQQLSFSNNQLLLNEEQEQQFQNLQQGQQLIYQQKNKDIKIYLEEPKNSDLKNEDQSKQAQEIIIISKKKVQKEKSLNEKQIIEIQTQQNQKQINQQSLQDNQKKQKEFNQSLQPQQNKQRQAENKKIKISLIDSIASNKNQVSQQFLYQPGIIITDQQVNQMSPEEIYEYFTQLDQQNQVGLQSKINLLDNQRVKVSATENCPICMEDIQPQKEAVDIRLDCNHLFHYDCIKQWLLQQKFCPICKERIYLINYYNFE